MVVDVKGAFGRRRRTEEGCYRGGDQPAQPKSGQLAGGLTAKGQPEKSGFSLAPDFWATNMVKQLLVH